MARPLHFALNATDNTASAFASVRQNAQMTTTAVQGMGRSLRSGMDEFGRSAGLARAQMINTGAQINDVGVSLASGQSPFLVLAQQGSQLVGIYAGQGGVRAAFTDFTTILRNVARFTWPIALVAGAFGALQGEINATSDVQVSFLDTVMGTMSVFGAAVWSVIDGPVGALGDALNGVTGIAVDAFTGMGNTIVNVMAGSAAASVAAWGNFPGALETITKNAVNINIRILEGLANGFIAVVNTAIDAGKQCRVAVHRRRNPDSPPAWRRFERLENVAIGGGRRNTKKPCRGC